METPRSRSFYTTMILSLVITALAVMILPGCGGAAIAPDGIINNSNQSGDDQLAIVVVPDGNGGLGVSLVVASPSGEVSNRAVSDKWPHLALVRVWCRENNASGPLVGGPTNPLDLTLSNPNGSFTGISTGTLCHITATVYADLSAATDVSTGTGTATASNPASSVMITLPPSVPTFGTASPSGTVTSVSEFTIPITDPAGGVPETLLVITPQSTGTVITYWAGTPAETGSEWTRNFSWDISGLTSADTYNWYLTATTTSGGTASTSSTFTIGGVDTTPPETTIVSGPSSPTALQDVTFVWTGTDDTDTTSDLTYTYQLDTGAWSSFTAATTCSYSGLADGMHYFRVKARDTAGNIDQSPAEWIFVVDTGGGDPILPQFVNWPGYVHTFVDTVVPTPNQLIDAATAPSATISAVQLVLNNDGSGHRLRVIGNLDLTTALMTGGWTLVEVDGVTFSNPGGSTGLWQYNSVTGHLTITNVTVYADTYSVVIPSVDVDLSNSVTYKSFMSRTPLFFAQTSYIRDPILLRKNGVFFAPKPRSATYEVAERGLGV